MIVHFKRGVIKKDGDSFHGVFLGYAHTSFIHRGQRIYIEYLNDRINVTHGPSGYNFVDRKFKFKPNDRPEDVEWKVRKMLDKNWSKLLVRVKEIGKCRWRY